MSKRAFLDDFEALTLGRAALVQTWADRHGALIGCRDLPGVVAAIRSDPDPVLAALLHEVATGCAVASRVILQAMLPKMIVMAGRDPEASLEDYLAHLWLRISTYPLARRPRRIAANLALDTLKAVKADQRPLPTRIADPDAACVRPYPADELSARRLLRTAVDLRLIDPTTHATMIEVYAEGLPEEEVAARHRVTPTTVRRRCNRAIRVLAEHASHLAEAA